MLGRFVTSLARLPKSGGRPARHRLRSATRSNAKSAKPRRSGEFYAHRIEALEKRLALSGDPIVTVDTNFGNFQMELLPADAPKTVANFLSYVDSGAYTNTIFHRSVPGFVVQTGGFTTSSTTFSSPQQFSTIPTNAAVQNEFKLSNTIGTVAMAKLGNDPNSATDQWFINLGDNSSNLDSQNGGFTVFAKVLGNGMQVANTIAGLTATNVDPNNANSPFTAVPLGPNNQLAVISSITVDSVDGTVFSDTNANGTQDTGEAGVAGRTVYVDVHGTGTATGNPQAVTDANGNFTITGVAPGTYPIREVLPNGYTPSTTSQTVTVTADQTTSGVTLGELVPSIVGTVFTDTNDNGKVDAGEAGVAGRTVFLNVDGSGLPTNNPQATTDANGNFAFPHQAPGTYTVMEALPANVTLSTGSTGATLTGSQSVTVNAGQTSSGVIFGEIPSIAGTVFTDLNDSGKLDTGDPGVAGRTVFVDVNGTGTATGNPQATTDANGNFTFTGLAPKTYAVKEVLPTNVTASLTQSAVVVAAGKVATANLGELPSITGVVFTDNNNNGTFDTGVDTPLAGHTVIANVDGTGLPDANNPSAITDANGNFALTGVPTDKAYPIEDVTSSGTALASQSVQAVVGQITKSINLAEAPHNSTISGKVFDDLNMNGTLDPGEPGIAGRTVFLDIDGTGQPDATNPSTTTDAQGNFSFTGLAAGPYTVSEVITPDHGTALTTAVQSVTVAVNGTQTVNLGDALTSTLAPLPISTNPITAANATTAYIDGIYQHLLGRLPGPDEVTYWTTQMTAGTSRAAVATSVWDSPEHRALEIGQYYQTFLGRAADPAGKAYWLNAFTQSWATEKNVIATFVTSDEFSNRLHASNTDYIDALYTDLDLRTADPSGLSGWQTALQNGESRLQAAFAFIDGQEASGQLVDGYYADFLHRAADAAGRQSWVNALTSGSASIEDVGVRILATDEYFSIVGTKNNT